MSITDELRARIHRMNGGWCCIVDTCFDELCDRIDAAHEEALISSYFDGVFSDEELAENGFVRLPKDANGEYIHIGDVMKSEKIGGGFCGPFEVVGYIMSNGELEPMDEHKCPRKHEYLHHHKQPTVEDVLTEFGIDWEHEDNCEDRAALIKEYAAKLQLKEQS